MSISALRAGTCALLLSVALVTSPTAARADEFQDHMRRAGELGQQQRFRDALREYQEAYARVQAPFLHLYIARSHMQLGEGREALDAYRRYLVSTPAADPESQREASEEITRLGAIYEGRGPLSSAQAPTGAPLTPQALDELVAARAANYEKDRIRRRNSSLMAGGGVLFGLGYAAAFMTGSMFLGLGVSSSDQVFKAASGVLIIPVAGPFVAGLVEPSVTWTIPWIFLDGAAQVGGLAMMILAAKSNRQLAKKAGLADAHLVPYSAPGQHGLALAGRF